MLLLAGICSVSVRAAGQREKVLHWFGAGKDGSTPIGGLVQDASGNLYGTAANAGAGGYGTVFELSPPEIRGRSWKETVLYAFQSVNDGRHPFGTLILDQAGNLYGTTSAGGRQPQCFDCGTVFELVRPARPEGEWREKILHSFNGKDGANPAAGLVADDQGSLYGTTFGGGATRSGTVFELMPPDVDHVAWTEKVLYSFTGGIDGNFPVSKLSFGPDGALYETTNLGGANGMGAVYRLAPPAATAGSWSETVIYSFLGGSGLRGGRMRPPLHDFDFLLTGP